MNHLYQSRSHYRRLTPKPGLTSSYRDLPWLAIGLIALCIVLAVCFVGYAVKNPQFLRL